MNTLRLEELPGRVPTSPALGSDGLRERLYWLAVVGIPLAALGAFTLLPSLNVSLENHWFHFQFVTFASFVAFVLGITTMVLLKQVADARAFFIPLGLGMIGGIFFIHGLGTPEALILPTQHAEHSGVISFFARPDLTVVWSAPLSLLAGAFLFVLASRHWSATETQWLLKRRRLLSVIVAIGYAAYFLCAIRFPLPFEWLSQSTPSMRYVVAAVAGTL